MAPLLRYLATLSNGKLVLWCYLIWWLSTVVHHFDPSLSVWLNSMGISLLIGVALILSVGGFRVVKTDRWQMVRLFAMPFCVSSFASLIKGKSFVLVFSPRPAELALSAGLCLLFVALVVGLRRRRRHRQGDELGRS